MQCGESAYINSREFRVNAGPVHAYCHMPDAKTAYLSELHAGTEVAVAHADGSTRTAIVGRSKVRSALKTRFPQLGEHPLTPLAVGYD